MPSFTFTTHRAGVRPAGRPAGLLRHRAADPRARPGAPRDAARRLRPRGRAGALRRHRLRRRRRAAGAGRPARRRGDRGQRPRPVRQLAAASRSAASAGSRRRASTRPRTSSAARAARCSLNDAARRRPGPGALRQGHQPAGVPARPGRQVLLEGHRLVVRAGRRAGGVPAGPARAAGGDPGQAPRGPRALHQTLAPHAEDDSASRCPARRPTASRRTTCSTCCCRTSERRDAVLGLDARRRRHADVPLRAAAQLGRRPDVRGPRRPSAR